MIHDDSERFVGLVGLGSDLPFELVDLRVVRYPYDEELIRSRLDAGAHLHDGDVLVLPPGASRDPVLQAGVGTYFTFVTQRERIARGEVLAAEQPVFLGGDVVCAFRDDDGWTTVLHERSTTVLDAPGLLTTTPAFTFVPNQWTDGRRSRLGLVAHNAVKELLEEAYDLEDEIAALDDPDAFLDLPSARPLRAELDAGRVELAVTGTATDPTTGALVLAVRMAFSSPDFLAHLRDAAVGSHEMSEATLTFRPLDESLRHDMTAERMKPSSIYAFDRALASLETIPPFD